MGPAGNEPFFNIKCMTFRNKPLYRAFISQMPPSESSCIRGVGREWPLFKHLKDTLRLPIRDLRLKEAGGAGAFLVISLKKQFDGQVRQLMYGAWSQRTGFGKITVVVDDDIDVWDDFAVDWALSWHVRPERDITSSAMFKLSVSIRHKLPRMYCSIIPAGTLGRESASMRRENTSIRRFLYRPKS